MIPYLDDLIELHRKNEMPLWELGAHVVESIAQSGGQRDYDEVPDWLKAEVRKQIASYEKEGGWFILSGSGTVEDYGPHVQAFLVKVRLSP